jgi:amino acid permease
MGDVRFATISTAIILLSYIVSMSVSSLDTVLAYVGATGSTTISFILPGLFYFKISSPDSIYHQALAKEDDDDANAAEGLFGEGPSRTARWKALWLRRAALTLSVYGVVVMVTCLTTNTFFLVTH